MIYLIIIAILLILLLRYDIVGKTKYRNQCYFIMLVIFILLAGLRYRLMSDTPNYIYSFYHRYPYLNDFSFKDYPIGKDPFYVLINSVVKSLGGRFYWVQLIEATFVNTLLFRYFKRHCDYIFTCLFFYAITCYLGYSMETMRASFSIILCLYANDYILLERKWIKGYILITLALMFHAQTVIMFVVPFLFFLRLNRKGALFLIAMFFIGFVVQKSLGDYLDLLELSDEISNKASNYIDSDKYGQQGGNINFFLVQIFPYLFYSLFCLFYLKVYHRESKVLKFEPFIMCGCVFLVLQMNMQIAYRFVDYFRMFFCIFFAETFVMLVTHAIRLKFSVAITRAIIIFIPFFLLVGYYRYTRISLIYPYSSVIERSVNQEREIRFFYGDRPSANYNEY